MRRFISFGPAFVVLITTLVMMLAAPAMIRRLGYATTSHNIVKAAAALQDDDILERLNIAVRAIAKKVEPSVVHIQWDVSSGRARRPGMAQGSGWVFDTAGHIVTNAHVVAGSPGLVVQFYDGRRVRAEVVGVDTTTDIAVIKAQTAEGLFPADRATDAEVLQGDRVYAFGSPFGFKFSMSEGIISGLGRDPSTIIGESAGYTNYIQSDAAVNPGNSGGPLVDIKGRVVGMNVAIATAAGGRDGGQSAGISFAIPLDTIESVVSQLVEHGAVAKGYLGVELPIADRRMADNMAANEEFNRTLVQRAGLRGGGVALTGVPSDGPAGKAGLQPGDVIVNLRGKPVGSIAQLRQAITINRPGVPIDVQVWRDGKMQEFKVTLGDLNQTETGTSRTRMAIVNYGILGVSGSDDGLQITSLRQGSLAVNDTGLRPGLVIQTVAGKKVTNADDLISVLTENGFANGRKLDAVILNPSSGETATVKLQYLP